MTYSHLTCSHRLRRWQRDGREALGGALPPLGGPHSCQWGTMTPGAQTSPQGSTSPGVCAGWLLSSTQAAFPRRSRVGAIATSPGRLSPSFSWPLPQASGRAASSRTDGCPGHEGRVPFFPMSLGTLSLAREAHVRLVSGRTRPHQRPFNKNNQKP